MKTVSTAILLFMPGLAFSATTINNANKHAYGANIGWLNAQGDIANGAVIGEYTCSGSIWGANVGWISLGTGAPANGIQYRNDSAADFGVNHDRRGNLRGYAYGANIGWLHFEDAGAPRVDLRTGRLSGFVWSANCGWIQLRSAFAHVRTDSLWPGMDSDGDGIPDAWELSYTDSLRTFRALGDADRDGVSDLNEHLADTSPRDSDDFLRITDYSTLFADGSEVNTVTWTSKETRFYQLDYRTEISPGTPWVNATAALAADPGSKTTQVLKLTPAASERYFRVEAIKPLALNPNH